MSLHPLLVLALTAMLGAALGGCRAERRAEPFDPFHEAGVDPHPGAAVPLDGRFQDSDGHWTTLRQLAHGRPLVLAPVQHRCPNLCGLTLEGLQAASAGQSYRPGQDFVLVAFGLDPRESAAAAKLSQQRLSGKAPGAPGVHALVGPAPQIAAVTKALGYRFAWDPRIGQYAHIAAVAVLTPQGRLARWLYGLSPRPQDLHLALTDAGRGRLGNLGEQLRLLCYHYDPVSGRYDGLALTALRLAGMLAVVVLAGLIGVALLRDRRRPRAGS